MGIQVDEEIGAESTNITQVNSAAVSLGQKVSASAFPIVIASDQSAIPVNVSGYAYSSYSPDPSSYPTSNQTNLSIDAVGRLETHSTCTTDEGSFRDDFSGTGLITTLTGTLTFTNGSNIVTGSGTNFTTIPQYIYIKKSTDSDTLYCEIDHVGSDTTIYLTTNYAGTTASGVSAVVSSWFPTTGTGGSIAIASSVCSLNSGTTNGSSTYLQRVGDYLPYTANFYLAINQRIANQSAKVGLMDNFTSTGVGAYIQFTGTNNTQLNLVTQSSSSAADTQTTTVTLPGGALTSAQNFYKLDLAGNSAVLSINGTVVARNMLHLPGPYSNINLMCGITNTGAAASTTALQIDMLYFYNTDRIQVDDDFSGEPINVTMSLGGLETYVVNSGPITGATATGTKSLAYLWHPSSVTNKYKIASIIIDQIAGNGSGGSQRIEMNRITAENATPGGTTGTIVTKEPGATASGATFRIAPTGAPTRAAGTLFGLNLDPKANGQVLPMGSTEQERVEIKPWTILTSTAFGYEITQVVTTTLSSAPIFNITVEWTET
jgi:hypothetical protein